MNWELLVAGGAVALSVLAAAVTVGLKMGTIITKLDALERAFGEHKDEFRAEQRNTADVVRRLYDRIERTNA